jgi:hypothetical protein
LRLTYVRGPDGVTLEFLQPSEDARQAAPAANLKSTKGDY